MARTDVMKVPLWTCLWVSMASVSCETRPSKQTSEWLPPVRSFKEEAYRQSIHHHEWKVDTEVTNGDCYEQFKFELPSEINRICLPPKTVVYRLAGREVIGHVKKSLSFVGHTHRPISIVGYRARMGIAARITWKTLHLSAFGGQDSFEGGTYVNMVIGVPDGVVVRFAKERTNELRLQTPTGEGWLPLGTAPALKGDYDRVSPP